MPNKFSNETFCMQCNKEIVGGASSSNRKAFPLCMGCQHSFKNRSSHATSASISLYAALKKRGVPAELENYSGFKSIDIAVPDARVLIEVDSFQFNDCKQALKDMKRKSHSIHKGYLTLRIPNVVLKKQVDEAADYIKGVVIEVKKQEKRSKKPV